MPNMDGKQVAQVIKRESPITPIIMLTGWGSMMEADGNTPKHIDLVLGKPPKLNDLMEALADLTNGDRAVGRDEKLLV
jgi:CheY-like chemotaxis protein